MKKIALIEIMVFVTMFAILLALFLSIKLKIDNVAANSVIMEINRYQMLIDEFKMKFNSIPGDTQESFSYNLSAYNTDGNNDGIVYNKENDAEFVTAKGEVLNFWVHLCNFNNKECKKTYSKNHYKNYDKTYPQNLFPNINFIDRSIVMFGSYKTLQNYLQIGMVGIDDNGRIIMSDESFKPRDAFFIDNKIDDSSPKTGKISPVSGKYISQIDIDQNTQNKCVDLNFNSYNLNEKLLSCQIRVQID